MWPRSPCPYRMHPDAILPLFQVLEGMADKPAYYYAQSGVIPYQRGEDGGWRVLLITSNKGKRWVIPKGIVEPGDTSAESAAEEAWEEAGIRGRVHEPAVGRYEYEKWGGVCDVEVFLMRVDQVADEWDESHRDRRWFDPDNTAEKMRERDLAALIRAVPRMLPTIEQR